MGSTRKASESSRSWVWVAMRVATSGPAGGQVGVDLERRVLALDARETRARRPGPGRRAARTAAACPRRRSARAGPRPARAARVDLGRLAAHEHELRLRHQRGGVHQQLHALVGLEVARVEDDGPRAEPERRGAARPPPGVRRDGGRPRAAGPRPGRRARAGRARPHAVGEARADGDHGGGVPEGVALERSAGPEQRALAREAASSGAGRGSRSPRRPRAARRSRRAKGATRCAASSTACTTS